MFMPPNLTNKQKEQRIIAYENFTEFVDADTTLLDGIVMDDKSSHFLYEPSMAVFKVRCKHSTFPLH